MLSTSGGTFADIEDLSGVKIENCYLKGFANGVIVSGIQNLVQNNTFASVQYPISENGTYRTVIMNNKILNATTGIFFGGAKYGTLDDNIVINATKYAIEILNGIGSTISSNFANIGTLGMYIYNNTESTFSNNRMLNMTGYGISCRYGSNTTSYSMTDSGGNVCSSNNECVWMSSSTGCLTR